MRTTHVVSAIALAVSLAAGALTGAAVFARDSQADTRVDANARLSIPQVHARMTALGYRDIDQIERERNLFEVDARTSAGERVKLYVDARSGEVLRTKSDARDRIRDRERLDKEVDRATPDCTDRRCRDDDRTQTLSSETLGWYLSDIYGRMKAVGI
ncbi:MAG: PepSY domain-containing protein [Burkholderiales bacterium]|nr:PepSY domain-containing protein [Burkholderiales bacterium]